MNISRRFVNCFLLVLLYIGVIFFANVLARDNTTRSPSVPGGGVGGDAETIDGIDSPQFLRSDVGDAHGGGTLSVGAIDVNGGNIDGAVLSASSMVTGDFSYMSGVRHDVRAYGATGDGVTDDTAAIQNTIDAAKDYNTPGTVFFPAGKYRISSPLTIDRRVKLLGVGRGSQIFQESDEHLISISPYMPASAHNMVISELNLGSAAVTAGKALVRMVDVGGVIMDNVTMAGGSYGISMSNSHSNRFTNLIAYPNIQGFFAACAAPTRWVSADEVLSNANVFINPDLEMSGWGFYMTSARVLTIIGGTLQGGASLGAYFEGITRMSILNIHFESTATNFHFTNCSNVDIFQILQGGGSAIFDNCDRVSIHGCYFGGSEFTIKPNCKRMTVTNVQYGSTAVNIAPGTACVHGLHSAGQPQYRKAGESGFSVRNLVDGDLEVWSGFYPVGFGRFNNPQAQARETGIVKFGNCSAKITISAGQSKAGFYYTDFDYAKYSEMYLNNYRTLEWTWTLSALGTNEYYLRDAASADPDLCGQPKGVKVNGAWADEGTMGSLADAEFDFGDNDSLGYNTIYVRNDGGDIDSEAVGYVEATFTLVKITLSAWVYKESGSASPYLGMEFNGGNRYYAGLPVPIGTWTRIAMTFDIPTGYMWAKPMFCNCWWNQGSPGDVVYWDGLEVLEGDAASPIFDDSRKGDFSNFGGVGLPVYTNANRPGANTVPAGLMIWNSDDNAPNFSDGTNWRDAAGTIT